MPLVVPGIQTSLTGNQTTDWVDKLLGKKLTDSTTDEVSFAKRDLPAGHRVLQPGSMATADWKPDRLNVHLDEDGTVMDVRFG